MSVRGKPPPPPEDDPAVEWEDAPRTVSDEHRHRLDTPSRDLTALARATSGVGTDAVALAYSEGQEDAIRALYALMRQYQQPADWIDNFVLAVRLRLTRL